MRSSSASKNSLVLIYGFICLLMLFLPVEASAQLVPACEGTTCSACHLVDLANNLVTWLIGVITVLFAVLMAVAGFKLVTAGGNPSALQSAKGMFVNGLIGFLIVLSAWLLVDTVMRGLVGSNGEVEGWGPWADIHCFSQTTPATVAGSIAVAEAEDTALIAAGLATTSIIGAPVSNCGFDESTLVSIPGGGGHQAIASVASRYTSMLNAATAAGITLNINSSYRDDAYQTGLWDDCSRCQREGTVARPCSRGGGGSRHSSGVALDLSSSGSRCDVVRLCRSAGASFIMMYNSSGHVHCDWGGRSGEVNVSCP